jgi:hypothetical protein
MGSGVGARHSSGIRSRSHSSGIRSRSHSSGIRSRSSPQLSEQEQVQNLEPLCLKSVAEAAADNLWEFTSHILLPGATFPPFFLYTTLPDSDRCLS